MHLSISPPDAPFLTFRGRRGFAGKRCLWLWICLVLLSACGRRPPLAERVSLRLTTSELEPGSQFEVVFADPVASFEQLGTPGASPVQVDPPLAGTFVWRSRHSGVFQPSEPMRLGTRYEFSLRPGLKDQAGRAVNARLRRFFETPGLRIVVEREGWWMTSELPALPKVNAFLNAHVKAEELTRHARFTDGRERIPARVEVLGTGGTSLSTEETGWRRTRPTWVERFPGWTNALPVAEGRGAAFRLQPERPLESTNEWRLEIASGVASSESGVALQEAVKLDMGYSVPFEVESAGAANFVRGGRQVRILFSRPVTADLQRTNLTDWLVCEPPIADLQAERSPGGSVVAVRGSFALKQKYRIRILPGLRSEEPLALKRSFETEVEFEPIRPAVWLANFEAVQLATGGRRLDMLALNTPETRLRVKSLDRHGLIPTLRAYERYLRTGPSWNPDVVPGAALDYAGIPGRTVVDTNFVTRGEIDQAVRLEPTWTGLLPARRPANGRRAGAFFVEADLHHVPSDAHGPDSRVGPQAIVQLTDLGLVVKTGEHQTLVWVFSHETGHPVAGATVSLRSEENQVLEEAVTDAAGLVHLTRAPSAQWVLAELDGDLHAHRLHEGQVSLWNFRLPNAWESAATNRLFAFSDRGAYRPGERVQLKVLARTWDGETWQLPADRQVTLQMTSPRGDLVLKTNLTLKATGSAEWAWDSPTASRGTFVATLAWGDVTLEHRLEVRDFQPPAFEVTLGGPREYGPGVPPARPVVARYLFGQELSRAKVLWTARASDAAIAPEGWRGFRFGPNIDDWRLLPAERPAGEVTRHETTVLNAGTPLVLTPDLPFNPVFPQPQAVELLVEVTDLNGQTVSQAAEFVRHPSDFYLGFRWARGEETLLAAGVPAAFQVVAVGPQGEPWPTAVEWIARLRRVEWKSVAVQEAGRVIARRSEPEYQDVSELTGKTALPVKVGSQWQVPEGPEATHELPALAQPGTYILELRGRDSAGRPVLTTLGFAVAGDGRLVWHQRNGAQLEMIPDRAEHPPGGQATFLLKAPFPGTALVTVEREDVRETTVVEVGGNAPAISLPVDLQDAPNVFVGVTLVRGRAGNPHAHPMPEWRVGYETLTVSAPQDRLVVGLELANAVRAPGEDVGIRATVRDAAAQPVAGAEVTLYAVDEGYLLLTGAPVPDPLAAYSMPRPLRVTTALSLDGLLPEDPEQRHFENKGFLAGGGGRLGQERRNMIPCPYWNGSLVTDERGEVRVSFVAPDSLTRYRVVAVATRGARAMGSGAGAFEVRKPLMIEPAMPRFAHVGDQLLARALIFNKTDRALAVAASLIAGTNAVLAPGATGMTRLTVPSGGTAVVEFPVTLQSPGSDLWRWRVEAEGFMDSVAVPLPVTRAEALLRDVRHLRVVAAETNLLAGADPAVLELPESVSVRLAVHPLALLGEGVEQLLHYPYGCVEQTGSSLLPWLALRDFPGLLPADQRAPAHFAAAIRAGVERFWSMQTPAGGLAYWPGSGEAQRWGSAYGAWILALARDAGADVSSNRLARLHLWLAQQWRNEAAPLLPQALHERCLTALALAAAGLPDIDLQESLLSDPDRLTPEDRALLAVALSRSGDREGRVPALLTPRTGTARSEVLGQFGNAARVTALRLLAHASLNPQSAETLALVDELLGRRQLGHWVTTQGNAWALWALTDQVRRSPAAHTVTGQLQLGSVVRPFVLDRDQTVVTESWGGDALGGAGGLKLTQASGTPLFVEVTTSGRPPAGKSDAVAMAHGLGVRRRYEKVDDENRLHPADGLIVGDRVLVTLELEVPEDTHWAAIEDPVPAVLEPLQGVFRSDTSSAADLLPAWTSDYHELRFDRMQFFRDSLPEGRHVLRYLARVRAAGDVVAAPAKVEAMYQPERHGFSGGQRLRASASP